MSDNYSNNEMESNNNFNLSSVLSKLSDLNRMYINLSEIQKQNTERITYSDELKTNINNEINDKISSLTYMLEERVNSIMYLLKKTHVKDQREFGLKIQQEIASLKKEKFELQAKVANLNKRIEEIEISIGYDPK